MVDRDDRLEEDKDRIAAYLLGAVDPIESEAVELLLDRSPALREYAAWLRASVNLLPQSVEQHSPPPDLKKRLMTEVRRDAAAHAKLQRVERGRRWSFAGFSLRPAFAAGAATIVAIAAGAGYLVAADGGPDVSRIEAKAAPSLRSASATLVRSDGDAHLEVQTLPPLPSDRVYQVWLRRGDRITPSSLFVLDSQQKAAAAIPQPLSGVDEVMVTREPTGGSAEPTDAPLLRVAL